MNETPFASTAALVESQTAEPTVESGRIDALDVLRGIALLGMFMVHFADFAARAPGAGATWSRLVALFFEERFYTMFGILFGAGFAIQLRRAEARGDRFVPRYLRRLVVLFAFGFIASAGFGMYVLLGYALWGLPLLFVRNWSTRALIVLLLVCAASESIYLIARSSYAVATIGADSLRKESQALAARDRTFRQEIEDSTHSPHYATFVRAHTRFIPWLYSRPGGFLPGGDFVLFLLGFLGLRLGLFERPRGHRRMIIGLMVFGAVSWAISEWVIPLYLPLIKSGPLLVQITLNNAGRVLGMIRLEWLSFAYIGAVLLLIGSDRQWLRRLAAFGWTGRMALSNYMLQIAILNLVFAAWAFDASMPLVLAPLAALALFALDVVISRWWLVRFRYGPLEWIWRSATYARWQPLARATP